MNTLRRFFINYFKGIIIGFGTLIPGVSGGTTAIVLGVFKGILESVSHFFSDFKKAFSFLCPIFFGVVTGILILSSKLNIFCIEYPKISKYVFCFLSLISTTFFVKKVLYGNFKKIHFVYIISGIIITFLLAFLISTNELDFQYSTLTLLLIGIVLSIALILPAISFSYMLLFFGIYQTTLSAVENMNLSFVLPLSVGVVLGTYVFSKILNKMLNKHPIETYSFVLGFVLTSIIDIVR